MIHVISTYQIKMRRDEEEWPNPTAEAMGFETQSLKRPTFACE